MESLGPGSTQLSLKGGGSRKGLSGAGSPSSCHPPTLILPACAIPALVTAYWGPVPWDEGRVLQPVWELPEAHGGSLLPRCSAELLKRLGSKLVVKQKKNPKHFIIHQTAAARFTGVIL